MNYEIPKYSSIFWRLNLPKEVQPPYIERLALILILDSPVKPKNDNNIQYEEVELPYEEVQLPEY